MTGALILRPSWRAFRFQSLAVPLVAGGAAALALVTDLEVPLVATVTGGLVAGLAAQALWLARRGPRAVVADAHGLLLGDRRGARRRLLWTEIRAASHRTGLGGMAWHLEGATGVVRVRDVGIDPDRWGVLWHTIVREVASRGQPVRVDLLSNRIYD